MRKADKFSGAGADTASVGRPRNKDAEDAIMQAALRLLGERGYRETSISAIVTEAGVARQTLYNRWATKAELVLDAIFVRAGSTVASPDLAAPIPRRDLLDTYLRAVFEHLERDGEALRALIAAAQADEGFREIFWTSFVERRGLIVQQLLEDAQSRGELAPSRDPELLSSFVHGAFWYRLLNGQQITRELATAIADDIFRA